MGDGYGYRQWRGCTCSQPVLQQQREKQSGSGHEATSRPSQSPRRSNGYDHRHRHSDARCPGCSSTSTSFGFGSGSSKTNGLGSPYEYARNTRRHSKLENQLRLGQEEKAGTPRRRSRTTSANSTGSDSISGGSSISVSPTTPYTSFGRASASVQAPGHMRHSSGSSGLGAIYEHSRGHLSSQGHLREADMKDVGTAYDSRNTLDDPERGIRFSDPFPPRRRRVSPSSASHSTDLTTLGQGDAGIGTGKTATGTGMTRGDRRARLSVRFNLDHAVLNVNNANPADPCCQDYTRTALKPVSTCGTGSGRSSALGSGRVITPDWLNRSDHIHTNSDANAKGRPHGIEVNYFSFSAMDNDQSPNDDGQVMTQLQSLPLPTKSTEEMTWPISPEEATHGSPSLLPTPLPTPIPGSNTYVGALAGTGAGGSSVAVTSGNVIGHRIEHAWMDVRGDSESDSIVTR
ncbi:hypothetical protein I317_04221 [Kwoniella heveanensis CBS 569]|nr:hypothetical protein I317_04221 [Kwoniella heveanensis CBS 569]